MYDIFSLPDFTFPEKFIWGSASAGHQIEGDNIHSQIYRLEMENKYPGKSGKACNNYELFLQDADMTAELGHQAYRFSVEWSRIEPAEGEWDESALDHYEKLLERLKGHGIRTYVTLFHFTCPQWFEERGGLTKKENIPYFLRYTEKVVKRLAPLADYWLVMNESFHTLWEPFGFNFIRTHAQAYHLIKTLTKAPVSSAHMALQCYPNRYYDELDRIMTAVQDWKANGMLLHAVKTGELIAPGFDAEDCPEAKGAMDFWGLNFYVRNLVNSRRKDLSAPRYPHKKLRMIDLDFYLEEMFPEGATALLDRFSDRPIHITENGCSCNDDRFRIVYMALYLSAVHDAIKHGADVRSYLYWSLMDNYEWGSFVPRFGLVHVDFKTFERTPKPSAFFFRDIIQQNGFTQDILRKYLHEMPSLAK